MARDLLDRKQTLLAATSTVTAPAYNEMNDPDGTIRPHYAAFSGWLERTPQARIAQKRDEAVRAFHRVGITFAVYGEDSGTERLIPFDIVPRIIPADEWKLLDTGLRQRVKAYKLASLAGFGIVQSPIVILWPSR